ncbi:hypothetical protein ES707_05387 [subsurface metagenome]
MAASSAVGIDDDFSAGQAAIAFWASYYEFAGGIDVIYNVSVHETLRQNGQDDFFDYLLSQLFISNRWCVLG